MDGYLCLTVLSRLSEPEGEFKARLSAFWTKMLRGRPDDFEKVYAETVAFERQTDRLSRRYLIEAGVASVLEVELPAAGLDHAPLDPDDLYTKYEAAPPDWFWIEH
ncbi:MAG TPA: hypothetical protein VMZ71_17850 [Gemmataceae bacterium]|nr:hypothetical protein [Gemmataceae bacterium]